MPPGDPNTRIHDGIAKVKDHAHELSRQAITEELTTLRRESQADPNAPAHRQAKEHILTRLKRALPGSTTSISAIQTLSGDIVTSASDIAEALKQHWQRTFTEKPIDTDVLTRWLDTLPSLRPDGQDEASNNATHEANTTDNQSVKRARKVTSRGSEPRPTSTPTAKRAKLPTEASSWHIRRNSIQQAIQQSRNSAPGPDGIPYIVWRSLGDLAIDLLLEVAELLESRDSSELLQAAYHDELVEGLHGYNLGKLVCLPKKASGVDEHGLEYYAPEDTRPLTLVNCDNRIIANATRLQWEVHLQPWVLQHQQGFLRGRSILANLIDVDTAMMETALTRPAGACILFDFKSAFPSVSQQYLHTVLAKIGLPENARNVVRSLYDKHHCQVHLQGQIYGGFVMSRGVRQGCPLSPLLYAIVAELLLERVVQTCPDVMVRAYADDTATVLNDFGSEAPKIQQIFEDFSKLSGLELNTKKTIIISLSTRPLETFKNQLATSIPTWSDMQVARSGTYLGFCIGPSKKDGSWEKAAKKYEMRVALWADEPLGLQYDTMVYNTFAATVIGYIAQLESPPNWLLKRETIMLRRAAKGPGKTWATPKDLWHLQLYGLTRSFTSLELLAKAAQLRVRTCDKACHDPEIFRQKVTKLRNVISAPVQLGALRLWGQWFQQSFLLKLDQNEKQVINEVGAMQNVSAEAPNSRSKGCFQGEVYRRLLSHTAPDPAFRIREKLDRWKLLDASRHPHVNLIGKQKTPAWMSEKTLQNLCKLRALVPPRVVSAVFSTVWNRWATRRRWQQRSSDSNICQLNCGAEAEDSIEHYARCPRTQELARRFLRLDPLRQVNLHSFMVCNPHTTSDADLTATALLVYSVYRMTNCQRFQPMLTALEDIISAMKQFAREGAKGHPNARTIIDSRWADMQIERDGTNPDARSVRPRRR